jgi:vacuolar-type H+-ATPase subunit I/STV1
MVIPAEEQGKPPDVEGLLEEIRRKKKTKREEKEKMKEALEGKLRAEYSKVLEQYQGVVAQLTRVQERKEEIRTRPRSIDTANAWEYAKGTLVETDSPKIDSPPSLHQEFLSLESQEKFLTEALEAGRHELNKARGRCSLEIWNQDRPKCVLQIRRILKAQREICEANNELERIYNEREQDGFASGSFAAHVVFDLGGTWNDPCGGRLVGYQRYIRENFPELAKEAE